MKTNWVLMTAMPVTTGHEALIKFANKFSARRDELTVVVLCTQPGEPYIEERRTALSWITSHLATTQLRVIPQEIEQNPEAPGFWDMWRKISLYSLGDILIHFKNQRLKYFSTKAMSNDIIMSKKLCFAIISEYNTMSVKKGFSY